MPSSEIVSPAVAKAIAWRSEQSVGQLPAPAGSSCRVTAMVSARAVPAHTSNDTNATAMSLPGLNIRTSSSSLSANRT